MNPNLFASIAALHDLSGTNPNDELMNHLSLCGHIARNQGVTPKGLEGHEFALLALASKLTPYARAALRLAAEVPDLIDMRPRARLAAARPYLPQ
jgi:hypothetical protein